MIYEDFGKFLRKKRTEKKISLNKFAIMADIDSAIISRIENGKQDVKLFVLAKIAGVFDMTASEFLAEMEQSINKNFPERKNK